MLVVGKLCEIKGGARANGQILFKLSQNFYVRPEFRYMESVLKMSENLFPFWQKNFNFSNVVAFIFQIGLLTPSGAIISKFEVQTKLRILT